MNGPIHVAKRLQSLPLKQQSEHQTSGTHWPWNNMDLVRSSFANMATSTYLFVLLLHCDHVSHSLLLLPHQLALGGMSFPLSEQAPTRTQGTNGCQRLTLFMAPSCSHPLAHLHAFFWTWSLTWQQCAQTKPKKEKLKYRPTPRYLPVERNMLKKGPSQVPIKKIAMSLLIWKGPSQVTKKRKPAVSLSPVKGPFTGPGKKEPAAAKATFSTSHGRHSGLMYYLVHRKLWLQPGFPNCRNSSIPGTTTYVQQHLSIQPASSSELAFKAIFPTLVCQPLLVPKLPAGLGALSSHCL